MHLYLSGYRGTGKSTVARLLGQQLGLAHVDLDGEIERLAGKTVATIFQEVGEAGFRQLETASLSQLAEHPASVIALGGGAILAAENRETIERTGRCVWLRASEETICQRLAADRATASLRPRLTALPPLEEVRALLAEREPLYRQVATFSVKTDDTSVPAIVEQIVRWWET